MKQIISALIAVSLLSLSVSAYRYVEYTTSNERVQESYRRVLLERLIQ
ncbi:hypothetical protein [Arthronema virus TR020]|uniref:Uncharacterized protein n=1 Tax=Arthronema virus TR020 TaxID=2736280 RepID=A0A7G3WH16_9CAUD|nr:hypothetical protein [Arthronema virus TR020]